MSSEQYMDCIEHLAAKLKDGKHAHEAFFEFADEMARRIRKTQYAQQYVVSKNTIGVDNDSHYVRHMTIDGYDVNGKIDRRLSITSSRNCEP
jgi:hypothetical protein